MRWPLQGLRRLWVVLLSVPPPRWRAAGVVAGAASAGPAAAEGQDGRESVRPWRTHLPRCGHSRRFARASKSERSCLTFGTSFSAMRGTTGEGPQRNCTICSSHSVFRSGSARRTSSSARHCCAKSTRDLAKSRVGIVLVTPALLRRLQGEGIADKELSALLARGQLVPIVHGTTYEALREVSPLLGSRTGLSTAENPMAQVATKLAELVTIH